MQLSEVRKVSKPSIVCTTGDVGCDALDERLSRSWLRVAVAAVFAGQGMVFSLAMNMTPPVYASVAYWIVHGGLILSSLLVVAFLGGPLLRSTFYMMRARQVSIEGLFTLSLCGAFFGSFFSTVTGEGAVFYEVVSVVIAIYTIGRMVSERSQSRFMMESERLRERFEFAEVIGPDGDSSIVSVKDVTVGSRVRVSAGAAITVDGLITKGVGYVKETALTGEPVPVVRRAGDKVNAGTWSIDGVFEVEVIAKGGDRLLDTIIDKVELAATRPSDLQVQANRLIQFFLPTVAAVSLGTALYWGIFGTWVESVLNSMAVLLVACPCALGLATPVAIWQGLFQMAKMGLVSRDGRLIDGLAQTKQVFFDKTGTLSEAALHLSETLMCHGWQSRRQALLSLVQQIESQLEHPVARALSTAIPALSQPVGLDLVKLRPGEGVEALISQPETYFGYRKIYIGEASLMPSAGTQVECAENELIEPGGKRIFVFLDSELAAVFVLKERLRDRLGTLWDRLADMGIRATVLTGDPHPVQLLPDSVECVYGLSAIDKEVRVQASSEADLFPLFVGDGINDTAAMGAASASISMGSGSGLARSTATGDLTADQVEIIPNAIEVAREIYRKLRGNLIYAASYNAIGMFLAAAGLLHPIIAVLIMLASSFGVTMRALGVKPVSHNWS